VRSSQDLISNAGAGRCSNRQPGGERSEKEAVRRSSKNTQPTPLVDLGLATISHYEVIHDRR